MSDIIKHITIEKKKPPTKMNVMEIPETGNFNSDTIIMDDILPGNAIYLFFV